MSCFKKETWDRRVDIWPYVFEVSEGDKLDNVSGHSLSHSWPQDTIVSIQKLHGLKVSRPHPNNDDGQRQPRRPDNGVTGLVKVGDFAVSEDEEHAVLLRRDMRAGLEWVLVFLEGRVHVCVCVCVRPHRGTVALSTGGSDGSNVIDDRREICGSGEFQLGQDHPVGFHNPLNTWERQRGSSRLLSGYVTTMSAVFFFWRWSDLDCFLNTVPWQWGFVGLKLRANSWCAACKINNTALQNTGQSIVRSTCSGIEHVESCTEVASKFKYSPGNRGAVWLQNQMLERIYHWWRNTEYPLLSHHISLRPSIL